MKQAFSPKLAIIVNNVSGMVIPPRSVVVVTSVSTTAETATQEQKLVTNVDQYGCGKNGMVLVTGTASIGVDQEGTAYYDHVIYAAIDSGTPASGDEWGPSDGSWVLTKSRTTKGFIAHGYSSQGENPKMAMFARTFIRAAATQCSSSSDSSVSSGGSSVSGSSSASGACGCVTVVTAVSCSSGGLSVTYGQARGCC